MWQICYTICIEGLLRQCFLENGLLPSFWIHIVASFNDTSIYFYFVLSANPPFATIPFLQQTANVCSNLFHRTTQTPSQRSGHSNCQGPPKRIKRYPSGKRPERERKTSRLTPNTVYLREIFWCVNKQRGALAATHLWKALLEVCSIPPFPVIPLEYILECLPAPVWFLFYYRRNSFLCLQCVFFSVCILECVMVLNVC